MADVGTRVYTHVSGAAKREAVLLSLNGYFPPPYTGLHKEAGENQGTTPGMHRMRSAETSVK